MPRRPTVQQTTQRIPMLKQRMQWLDDRLQHTVELFEFTLARLTQVEAAHVALRERLTTAEQAGVQLRNRLIALETRVNTYLPQ